MAYNALLEIAENEINLGKGLADQLKTIFLIAHSWKTEEVKWSFDKFPLEKLTRSEQKELAIYICDRDKKIHPQLWKYLVVERKQIQLMLDVLNIYQKNPTASLHSIYNILGQSWECSEHEQIKRHIKPKFYHLKQFIKGLGMHLKIQEPELIKNIF